ncbi:MAG TPA: type II toxin-antitoxin system VapC family toxin [Terracidiphilus sp.]|jgi:tRNA(fMet)-specific endonuclease VapC
MLDTDISCYSMKGSNSAVLDRLRRTPVADVCISAITKCELMFGVQTSPRQNRDQARLEQFLRYVEALDFPQQAALHYSQIRADLKTRGEMIGSNDILIAAHARLLDLTLVTDNTREFTRVPGLKIENWAQS